MSTAPTTFRHRKAGHCGSGALRDLLEHHELTYGDGPLDEGPVFGLAGGLGFYYGIFDQVAPPMIYVVGRTGDLELDVAANLGVELDLRQTDDADEGHAWVLDELEHGRPVMVWADIAKLEYLRVKMSNTRHDIVIVGIDERDSVAWIADNDREDLQACSLESLAAARSSDGFPGPNRHTTFVYRWPDSLPEPDVACRRGIERALANMAGASAVGDLPGHVGLDGVQRFASDYAQWPALLGDGLQPALSTLSVLIVKAGTGGAMFRSLHAEFLDFFAMTLDNGKLGEAAATYHELAEAWRALAATARAGDHAGGTAHVEVIERLEQRGLDEMRDAL